MGERTPFITQSEVQMAVQQVRSVLGCRVSLKDGVVEEVHVLSTAERSPKQVARDVETILTVKYGLALDYRKISVAQLEEDDFRGQHDSRIALHSLRTSTSGSNIRVEVNLIGEGQVISNSAEGSGTYAGRMRLASEATLAALEKYLGEICHLSVDDVVPFEVGRWEGILVAVSLWTPQGEESLVGSALVQGDIMEAAVRATLDAVVRRIVMSPLHAAV